MYTGVNQEAYIIVFILIPNFLLHLAEQLSKSVRGFSRSNIHSVFACTLAVVGTISCVNHDLCLLVLITCMCRLVLLIFSGVYASAQSNGISLHPFP